MPWGAAIGVGAQLLFGGDSGGSASSGGSSQQQVYDPYAKYRGAAADKLNALMANPGSAIDTSYGQAMQTAASRTMAAQGYTGSGNALVAAANAGGTAYQQEFNNLVTLSGAGQSPAAAYSAANQQYDYNQNQQNQMYGQIGNTIGQIFGGSGGGSSIDWGSMFGGWGGV